jgi:hypothetical protein
LLILRPKLRLFLDVEDPTAPLHDLLGNLEVSKQIMREAALLDTAARETPEPDEHLVPGLRPGSFALGTAARRQSFVERVDLAGLGEREPPVVSE